MTAAPPRKQGRKPGFARRLGAIMNSVITAASYRFHVAMANAWRDHYNPLRGLTIRRAISLLEEGERGAFADLQWTYRYIEMQDATLGALVERRTAAIQRLDWSIKLPEEIPAGKEEVAKRQQAALKAAYRRLRNFSGSLEALAMASFRGFSHLEKVRNEDGEVVELALVDQWFWVRSGLYGPWQYNRDSKLGATTGEPIDTANFVIREVPRPINRVALPNHVRKGLGQKDWDGFIESFGIPAAFIIMPPDAPEGEEDAYLEAAQQIASDAKGALPHGSDVKTVDNGARGQNPFKEHIDYQDAQVILRGTGGKLTMLSEPTGLGQGATGAHEETFDQIAQAEAREVSEILQEQFDREILAEVTPGEECYAYFELAANEETNVGEIVKDVATLEGADLEVDLGWITEKTGYPVKRKVAAPVPGALPAPGAQADPADPLRNRVTHYTSFKDFVRAVRPGEEWPSDWVSFPRETGTLGIPREIMPQIQSGNRAAMVNFLRARGVDYKRETAKPADLKPTQAEFAPHKVEKAREHQGPQRALLVSSDNHVVDGHHQWLAALQDAPNVPIEVFRIKAPVLHVIGLILQMRSTGTDAASVRNREERGEALAKALGVTSELLEPVADLVEDLAADVQGERMDDAAWLAALEEAELRLPELFDTARAEELAEALEAALGGAALRGGSEGLGEAKQTKTTEEP